MNYKNIEKNEKKTNKIIVTKGLGVCHSRVDHLTDFVKWPCEHRLQDAAVSTLNNIRACVRACVCFCVHVQCVGVCMHVHA